MEAQDGMKIPSVISLYCAFLLLFIGILCQAQKQLVFLQNDKVIARFTEGDKFKFRLKDHHRKEGYITELTDFSIITSALDTIPFLSIGKVSSRSVKQAGVAANLGKALFVGGLGYIAIDQLNSLIGSTPSGFDDSNKTALVVAGVGAAILFIKPRYKKIGRGITIRSIDYRSPYFNLDR